MPITEFDRARIHEDIEQQTELIERKQALWECETNEVKKAALVAEIEQAAATIAHLKGYL